MELESIATKQDLQILKDELAKIFQASPPQQPIPRVIHSNKVRELLGNDGEPVSDTYIRDLRVRGILHPTKVGGLYLYNLEEVISLLPKFSK